MGSDSEVRAIVEGHPVSENPLEADPHCGDAYQRVPHVRVDVLHHVRVVPVRVEVLPDQRDSRERERARDADKPRDVLHRDWLPGGVVRLQLDRGVVT